MDLPTRCTQHTKDYHLVMNPLISSLPDETRAKKNGTDIFKEKLGRRLQELKTDILIESIEIFRDTLFVLVNECGDRYECGEAGLAELKIFLRATDFSKQIAPFASTLLQEKLEIYELQKLNLQLLKNFKIKKAPEIVPRSDASKKMKRELECKYHGVQIHKHLIQQIIITSEVNIFQMNSILQTDVLKKFGEPIKL